MFELLNVKWGPATIGTPSGTISWSSEIGGDLPIATGFDLSDIQNSLQAAFDAWEDVAAIDFQQVGSGADITVGTANLASPIVGQAGPFPVNPSSLFTMTTADVDFSTNETWSPFGGSGGINFYSVALHEIGHVIGLAHPDPADPSQIMNEVISATDLSDIDIAGAQFLYGLDDDDVPVDISSASDEGGGGGGGGGLLIGLLALLASFFTGGGALVAMAAGRAATSSNDDNDAADADTITPEDLAAIFGSHHDCHHHVGEDGMAYHGVTVAELMPAVDFTTQTNPCGCVGLCEHLIDPDNPVEDYLI